MTTLQEAKREMKQIELRKAELEKIIAAVPTSLIVMDGYNQIRDFIYNDNLRSVLAAEAYGEALSTLLLLRQQPGTMPLESSSYQYFIEVTEGLDDLFTDYFAGVSYKLVRICPAFDCAHSAQLAIDTIGKARILRMFHVLHGVA